jgi:hypothetical protein
MSLNLITTAEHGRISAAQGVNPAPAALERHYSVAEVAALWGLGKTKVREMFFDEPGVLRTQRPSVHSRKRQCIRIQIPESVILRVHGRLSGGGW